MTIMFPTSVTTIPAVARRSSPFCFFLSLLLCMSIAKHGVVNGQLGSPSSKPSFFPTNTLIPTTTSQPVTPTISPVPTIFPTLALGNRKCEQECRTICEDENVDYVESKCRRTTRFANVCDSFEECQCTCNGRINKLKFLGPCPQVLDHCSDYNDGILEYPFCFSPYATVLVQQQPQHDDVNHQHEEKSMATTSATTTTTKMMKDLLIGDKVLTASGNYKSVFTIDHYHHTKLTTYLQIHTTTTTAATSDGDDEDSVQNDRQLAPLELTPNHMVFITTAPQQGGKEKGQLVGAPVAVPASSIKIGDTLVSINGLTKVEKISSIQRNGLYNPLTVDGTIVVDGILTSVYTSPSSQHKSYIEIGNDNYKLMSFHNAMHLASIPYQWYIAATSSNGRHGTILSSFCSNMMITSYHNDASENNNKRQREDENESEEDEDKIANAGLLLQSLYRFWFHQKHDILKYMMFFVYVSCMSILSFLLQPTSLLSSSSSSTLYSFFAEKRIRAEGLFDGRCCEFSIAIITFFVVFSFLSKQNKEKKSMKNDISGFN